MILEENFNLKKEFQSQNQFYNVGYKKLSVPTIWKTNKIDKWTNKAFK